MAMESNALQLLGGLSTRTERRLAEEDALSQLFRPNTRFEGGYSNAPKAALASIPELPPPAYAPFDALKLRKKWTRPPRKEGRTDQPPGYSCSHLFEGELDLKTELLTPFKLAKEHSWNPVYVVLRGPLLCIHRRAPHIITSEPQAGKLIKSYTLQNAEAGLADDCLRVELEPLNARARMVLPRNRWEAYSRDRNMFQKIKHYILRLRVEEEQILFSTHSKTRAMAWLEALCSAMDIAPDIDERTDPRCFTETRNRARRATGLMRNRRLVREQERLFREHYPQFAEGRLEPPAMPDVNGSPINDATPSPTAEDDEEEQHDEENDDAENEEAAAEQHYPDWLVASTLSSRVSRAAPTRQPSSYSEAPHNAVTTITSELSSLLPPSLLHLRQTVHSFSSADFDPETRKWRPQHPWTYRHDILYRRKCLPVLVSNAPRASDIIVKDGKRLKIDWEKKVLIPLDAPLDLGIADEREDAIASARSAPSPLLWRRKQSPDAGAAVSGNENSHENGDGGGTGQTLELHATRSSGSNSNELNSNDNDTSRSRRASESAERVLSRTGTGEEEDNTGPGNGTWRARRILGELFRPKIISASVNGRRPSVTAAVGNGG